MTRKKKEPLPPFTLDAYREAENQLYAVRSTQGNQLIDEEFSKFFAACKPVEAIWWQQYTPYFNDGESCRFAVYQFAYALVGVTEKTIDKLYPNHGGMFDERNDRIFFNESSAVLVALQETWSHEQLKAWKRITSLQNDSDLMEYRFGDHVEIYAYPDAFDIADLDHE